jgi:hypothetical protein
MSFTREQYIDLLNTLQLKGISSNNSVWNSSVNVKDMRKALAKELVNLEYEGAKNNYQAIKKWIDDTYPYAINYRLPSIPKPEIYNSPLDNLKPQPQIEEPPNIESNPLVNQNFIPNENKSHLQQNFPPNSTDASMEALLNLVSTQRKEIKRLNNLLVPNRAQEFIQTHNTHVDKQTK